MTSESNLFYDEDLTAQRGAASTPDFRITDEGSLVGFKPVSEAALDWITENVESEPWQWMGTYLWVDHRMAQPLLDGIIAAGFEVQQ